jgi:hypothetical protein
MSAPSKTQAAWFKAQHPLVCFYCGAVGNEQGCNGSHWHADHIIPKHLGGSNERWNFVRSCASCNLEKGRKHPFVWEPKNPEVRARIEKGEGLGSQMVAEACARHAEIVEDVGFELPTQFDWPRLLEDQSWLGRWIAVGLQDRRCPVGMVTHETKDTLVIRLIDFAWGELLNRYFVVRWSEIEQIVIADQHEDDGLVDTVSLGKFQDSWKDAK